MQLGGVLFAIPWFFILLLGLISFDRFRVKIPSWLIILAFQVKVFFTFLLQWLYTYHYTKRDEADIYRFFDDGIILAKIGRESITDYVKILVGGYNESLFKAKYFEKMNAWIKPQDSGFYNDNTIMIKINSLLSYISDGHFEVHGLLFSGAAFFGLLCIAAAFFRSLKNQSLSILLISILPSFALLVSGGLKESVLFFGVGLLIWSAWHFYTAKSNRLKNGTLFCIGLFFMLVIKPYFLAFFLPASAALVIAHKAKSSKFSTYMIWATLLAAGSVLTVLAGFDLVEHLVRKQHEFINHSLEISPGSFRTTEPLGYSLKSVIFNIPSAIAQSLLMPLPNDIRNAGELLMMIENAMLIIIAGAVAYRVFVQKMKISNVLLMAVLTAIPGIVLIGTISPVLGATMRYRAPFIILCLIAAAPYIIPQKNSLE